MNTETKVENEAKVESYRLPAEISRQLTAFILSDEKSNLLLRGYLLGKDLQGQIDVLGDFTIVVRNKTT